MRKCYSVSRSSIDESVSRCWIVFRHGSVAKLTSVAEFSSEIDLWGVLPSEQRKINTCKDYKFVEESV